MEPKDPIMSRVIGANVVAWIGAGIGVAVSPEFGGDAFSAIVGAQNAMVGAFCGTLFGGGIGWLVDRSIGNDHRRNAQREHPSEINRPY